MKRLLHLAMPLCFAVISLANAQGPAPVASAGPAPDSGYYGPSSDANSGPVPLEWTPPALVRLSSEAAVKSSFTLDRDMLRMAAGVLADPDAPARAAINKLDGVSVHLLRFGPDGVPDEEAVNAIREAYHLRGWKHLVTTTSAGGPIRNETTDVWMVMDGVNLKGAVILAETAKSVTLVTVAGNLSPIDLMHLRGHFGIPRYESDDDGRAARR